MGLSRIIVALGSVLFLFMVATTTAEAGPIATPDQNCYLTAYSSVDRYGLTTSIGNDRLLIGDELTIQSNCEGSISVESDLFDNRTFNSGIMIIEMPNGYSNITIKGESWTVKYSNVTFMSYGSYYQGIINEYKGSLPQPVDINEDELKMREITASISTLILAWIGSVMIIDRFARYYVDRFFIEEVI